MSNLGRKLVRWTYSEITRLQSLYRQGVSREDIAVALGMTEERIRQRLQWESQAGTLSVARKKRRAAQRAVTKDDQKSPRAFIEYVTAGPKPTLTTLQERALRYAAAPRDLTGAFFGDPPIGFSALERRS